MVGYLDGIQGKTLYRIMSAACGSAFMLYGWDAGVLGGIQETKEFRAAIGNPQGAFVRPIDTPFYSAQLNLLRSFLSSPPSTISRPESCHFASVSTECKLAERAPSFWVVCSSASALFSKPLVIRWDRSSSVVSSLELVLEILLLLFPLTWYITPRCLWTTLEHPLTSSQGRNVPRGQGERT